jgi:polysaccharide export outer membrane protein
LRLIFAALAIGIALAGCSALPTTGPLTDDVMKNGDSDIEKRYAIVDIDDRSIAILSRSPGPSLRARFGDYRPSPDPKLGIGDEVRVTIWEAAGGGLFSAPVSDRFGTGSRSALIPDQMVSRDGTISVPYAGRIPVVGLTPPEVEKIVVDRLTGKAIEPQALVSLTRNVSNSVTVTGEVTTGARVPLTAKGDRILDVVAGAGGVRGSVHDTFVRLTRNQTTITVPMEVLLATPQENVFMRPGDILTLVKEPQSFTAFGAVSRNAVIPFDTIGMSLEEAVAKAGGLLDSKSDPDGVFLLRFEPPSLVHALIPERSADSREKMIPVVYRLSLRDAKSYFLARSFRMRDKDVLYVANSTGAELQKFLNLIGTITSPVISGVGVAGAVR